MNSECPLCHCDELLETVRRSQVPVHQNRLFATRFEAVAATRGDMSVVLCLSCGFVFNRLFDPNLLDYSANYDNAQHHSPAFAYHLESMRRRIAMNVGEMASHVVEIGCGQGDFLIELIANCPSDVTASGYDPAFRGKQIAQDGRIRFTSDYFAVEPGEIIADIVFSRHVIEHIAKPIPFLAAAARALNGRPRGRMFLETPCVEWIVGNRVWWDLFYEHCSYWSPRSLAFALRRAGLQLIDVSRVFGGQYLWVEAASRPEEVKFEKPPYDFVEAFREFGTKSESDIEASRDVFASRSRTGKVAIWGAGAKGATFAALVDPCGELLDCVVDINKNKQGKFIGGSGHPIVAPQTLASRDISDVFVMNPKYLTEVAAICEGISGKVRVVAMEQEVIA